jgi:hypothetical protein
VRLGELKSLPIHRLLENSAFDPERVAAMVQAYETAVRGLSERDGASRASDKVIAQTVIEIAQTGERDASIIAEKTVARLHR